MSDFRDFSKHRKISAGSSEFACAALVFILTLILAPFYTGGDQEHYTAFYNDVAGESFASAFLLANISLGSMEPIYPALVLGFSSWLPKLYFVAFFNSVLAFYSSLVLRSMGAARSVACFVILSNFYFYVLFFSAERLKFGVLFFVVGLYYWRKAKWAVVPVLLSPLTHAQMSIPMAGIVLGRLLREGIKKPTLKRALGGIVALSLGAMAAYMLYPHMQSKFEIYSEKGGDSFGIAKMIVMYILALKYSQDKIMTTSIFLPLVVVSVFVGSERLVMFAYFLFMCDAVKYKRGLNLSVLFVNVYFFWKSIEYVYKIIQLGNGFGE